MAKERRMAYIAPSLNSDLKAMAEDIDGNVNEILEAACELMVQAWRDGIIVNRAGLLLSTDRLKIEIREEDEL